METLRDRLKAIDMLLDNDYGSPAVILMRPVVEHMLHVILIDKGLWDEARTTDKGNKKPYPGLRDAYNTLERKADDKGNVERHELNEIFGRNAHFLDVMRVIGNDAAHNHSDANLAEVKGCRHFLDALLSKFEAKYPDELRFHDFKRFSKPLIDVTHTFANTTVTLKAKFSDRYIGVEKDSPRGDLFLKARGKAAEWWEEFRTAESREGNIAFKGVNGKWLSARVDAAPEILLSEAPELLGWENFRVYKSGDDYYIMSCANGKLLIVNPNQRDPVEATGQKANSYSAFLIADKK